MSFNHIGIPEHQGTAILFLHDGTEVGRQQFERLMHHVQRKTKKQCILLSTRDREGHQIASHFNLRGTKFVLIIRENNELHHVWSEGEHFEANQISHIAELAS